MTDTLVNPIVCLQHSCTYNISIVRVASPPILQIEPFELFAVSQAGCRDSWTSFVRPPRFSSSVSPLFHIITFSTGDRTPSLDATLSRDIALHSSGHIELVTRSLPDSHTIVVIA
ncbi:hypothetical protein NPIL_601211 [Nephila pilipes]|uniref:Uncharacterized protein n=1 Tax=Nephila pilipes TaxID=299642 RepID=A0A8X6T3R1_NEPPI|nr:hypothetical protein NPIL_601211 [Nephila pilipes]